MLGFGGFNSAHRHLIEVMPHLFFGAASAKRRSIFSMDGQLSTLVGPLSFFSNVSNSSYCSMVMRVGEID
jgi:hypothetical protein